MRWDLWSLQTYERLKLWAILNVSATKLMHPVFWEDFIIKALIFERFLQYYYNGTHFWGLLITDIINLCSDYHCKSVRESCTKKCCITKRFNETNVWGLFQTKLNNKSGSCSSSNVIPYKNHITGRGLLWECSDDWPTAMSMELFTIFIWCFFIRSCFVVSTLLFAIQIFSCNVSLHKFRNFVLKSEHALRSNRCKK